MAIAVVYVRISRRGQESGCFPVISYMYDVVIRNCTPIYASELRNQPRIGEVVEYTDSQKL